MGPGATTGGTGNGTDHRPSDTPVFGPGRGGILE